MSIGGWPTHTTDPFLSSQAPTGKRKRKPLASGRSSWKPRAEVLKMSGRRKGART